jgi:hypothetical protein
MKEASKSNFDHRTGKKFPKIMLHFLYPVILVGCSPYLVKNKSVCNTLNGACINSINSGKQFGEWDSSAICK